MANCIPKIRWCRSPSHALLFRSRFVGQRSRARNSKISAGFPSAGQPEESIDESKTQRDWNPALQKLAINRWFLYMLRKGLFVGQDPNLKTCGTGLKKNWAHFYFSQHQSLKKPKSRRQNWMDLQKQKRGKKTPKPQQISLFKFWMCKLYMIFQYKCWRKLPGWLKGCQILLKNKTTILWISRFHVSGFNQPSKICRAEHFYLAKL